MVLGKIEAIFDWEWGRNSAPRDGQKIACLPFTLLLLSALSSAYALRLYIAYIVCVHETIWPQMQQT